VIVTAAPGPWSPAYAGIARASLAIIPLRRRTANFPVDIEARDYYAMDITKAQCVDVNVYPKGL
jgi:hypothetical protein